MGQGKLYIVATPIGNVKDITIRATEIFSQVAYLVAEDTRHTAKLLKMLGISCSAKFISMHQHNELSVVSNIVDKLQHGSDIALVSDAGTPLINDPGFPLLKACIEQAIRVVPIPGCCAAIAALCASGIVANKFSYEGFLPSKSTTRIKQLHNLKSSTYTMIFYEAPHRIISSLEDMCSCFGSNRNIVIAREISKQYETFLRGSVSEVLLQVKSDLMQQKGEMVLIVAGLSEEKITTPDNLSKEQQHILETLLNELSIKQASGLASKITGVGRKVFYDYALSLER